MVGGKAFSIQDYNNAQNGSDKQICELLKETISSSLPQTESKVWHAHPVWFIEGNPIVGYSKLKDGVRLLFWSGASFDEHQLKLGTGKFKDASICYTHIDQINMDDLGRWLEKSCRIQWDYKNVVKRKGKLIRLT